MLILCSNIDVNMKDLEEKQNITYQTTDA